MLLQTGGKAIYYIRVENTVEFVSTVMCKAEFLSDKHGNLTEISKTNVADEVWFPLAACNEMQEEMRQTEGSGGWWAKSFKVKGTGAYYLESSQPIQVTEDAKIGLFTVFTVGKGSWRESQGISGMPNLF